MTPKTWEDQPATVEECERLGELGLRDGVAEFRKHPDGRFYVTAGNLFGSQTVRCDNAEVALRVLASISKAKKGITLPSGAILV